MVKKDKKTKKANFVTMRGQKRGKGQRAFDGDQKEIELQN
jgi:hypothetical protein